MIDITKIQRDDLIPYIINTYNIKSMIEIGVRDGGHIKHLLYNSSIESLIGIDIAYYPQAAELQKDARFKYYIISSLDAAKQCADNIFDIIYVDASHKYEDAIQDIHAWYPKLKDGGFFIGDDYCHLTSVYEGSYGVVEAIYTVWKAKCANPPPECC